MYEATAWSEAGVADRATFDDFKAAKEWCDEQAVREDVTHAELRVAVTDVNSPPLYVIRVGVAGEGVLLTEVTTLKWKEATTLEGCKEWGSPTSAWDDVTYPRYEVEETPRLTCDLECWRVVFRRKLVRSFSSKEKAAAFAAAANYALDDIARRDPIGRLRLDVDWKFVGRYEWSDHERWTWPRLHSKPEPKDPA